MSAAVYVFKSDHGFVKIGRSRNPEKRLICTPSLADVIVIDEANASVFESLPDWGHDTKVFNTHAKCSASGPSSSLE